MEQAELARARQRFEDEIRARLAGTAIDKVELLQYGDAPEIEPGELLGRVFLAVPEGMDPADMKARHQVMATFREAHPAGAAELQKAFGGSEFGMGAFVKGPGASSQDPGPVLWLKMKPSRSSAALGLGGDQPLTPVMARLGSEDLDTLDTLISAGIAGSRAEAVRWTLARIRERPAYKQLRARAREIEDLKSQF